MNDTSKCVARVSGLAAATVAALGLIAGPALAQQARALSEGKIEYQENCAACHGDSGKGDGTLASLLAVPPPDLTGIAKRHGGEFPYWHVYRIIGGEEPLRAHQLSPMPIWASRFREEAELRWYPPAHARILMITDYLESIQEK